MEAAVFVGVDVSMERLDVGLWPSGETFSDSNDPEGIARLGERMAELKPRLVVLESTGRLEVPMALELQERGIPYRIVNPRHGPAGQDGPHRRGDAGPLCGKLQAGAQSPA